VGLGSAQEEAITPLPLRQLSAIIASIEIQEATMAPTSLKAKKAYYAKVRQSNYAASLRLEGFDTTPEDGERPLPSKESVLNSYRTKRS
jgi:hypothetical protein